MTDHKIIGFTCGAFDLFHAGHVLFFSRCKEQCDFLFVGLQTDPTIDRPEKNKPIQSMFERYVQVIGCKYVDHVIPYDTEKDLLNLLLSSPIDKRFVGSEYKNKDFTGRDLYNKTGINLIFIDRNHSYSSSELRKRIEQSNNI